MRCAMLWSLVTILGASCLGTGTGVSRAVRPAAATLQERLAPLLKAHGLVATNPPPAGVRCTWNVETADGAWRLEVGVRPGRPELVWLLGAESGVPVAVTAPDFRQEGSAALGLALQVLPCTLSLPWILTSGRWELRELLAPPDRPGAQALEVAPLGASGVVGPFRLEVDHRTGLLRRVLYGTRHVLAGGAPLLLDLEAYEAAAGIQVARRRRHSLELPVADPDLRDLIGSAGRGVPSPTPIVEILETIERLQFLGAEEVDRVLPLPADGA